MRNTDGLRRERREAGNAAHPRKLRRVRETCCYYCGSAFVDEEKKDWRHFRDCNRPIKQ